MPLTWQADLAPDGMVPGLSPPSRTAREAAGVHYHHGLPAGRQSGRDRTPAGGGIPDSGRAHTDQLFHLPSMSDSERSWIWPASRATLAREAQAPEFHDLLEREFRGRPSAGARTKTRRKGRRNFLKLMGASLALAGLTACTRQPTEHIMPYVRQPEDLIPGKPLFLRHGGDAGRRGQRGAGGEPRRPAHQDRRQPRAPGHAGRVRRVLAGLGAGTLRSGPRAGPHLRGEISSWGDSFDALRDALAAQKSKNGAGIRILTETVTSPTLARQLRAIQKAYPASKWHQWEPAGPHSARAAASLAFGQPINTYYDLANANIDRFAGFGFPGSRARPACATRGSLRRGAGCAETRPP